MPAAFEWASETMADAHSAAWWALEFARQYQKSHCPLALSLSERFRALHQLYLAAARFDF